MLWGLFALPDRTYPVKIASYHCDDTAVKRSLWTAPISLTWLTEMSAFHIMWTQCKLKMCAPTPSKVGRAKIPHTILEVFFVTIHPRPKLRWPRYPHAHNIAAYRGIFSPFFRKYWANIRSCINITVTDNEYAVIMSCVCAARSIEHIVQLQYFPTGFAEKFYCNVSGTPKASAHYFVDSFTFCCASRKLAEHKNTTSDWHGWQFGIKTS